MSRRNANSLSDPTSLGSLLLKATIVTSEQLESAVEYQRRHPDIMVGEALIRMGLIDRATLDALLLRQRIERKNDRQAVGKLVDLATKRTRETTLEMRGLRVHVMAMTGK